MNVYAKPGMIVFLWFSVRDHEHGHYLGGNGDAGVRAPRCA